MASDLVEQYAAIEGAPLGTGSYGSVGKVRRKRDLTVSSVLPVRIPILLTWLVQILACKTIDIESESTSANKRRDYDRAKREVGILAKLHHPNIIRYNDAHWESRQVKLYMEMCDEGSLKNLVTEYSRLLTLMCNYRSSSIADSAAGKKERQVRPTLGLLFTNCQMPWHIVTMG